MKNTNEMPKRKAKAKACSVKDCPEKPACLLKHDAMRCAVYRAIVVRKMKVKAD